ncbi:hypothetical protein OROMI_004553 [Orobanche minor]
MKFDLSYLLLFFLLSASNLGVIALSLDGTTLLSLVRHWRVVPPSIKSSWNASNSTPCSWPGVHCNPQSFIVELNLSSFGISGQLGPEIAYLKYLKSIDISYNSFYGSVPSALGDCSLLEDLVLFGNSFSGRIPENLGNLHNLQYLDLSGNKFSGEIPENLGKLQRLQYLSLWSNFLVGGIPESLFRIPFLSTIYLNNNELSGSIPSNVGNLSRLEYLYLEYNRLVGIIPSSIGNCSSLQVLFLNDNYLKGVLPDSLNNLSHLVSLFVENNNLTGKIPFLGNCKELQNLVLSNNPFGGNIPAGLGNCSGLTKLAAVSCGLSGHIPSSLGHLSKLTLLYLSENHLSGKIPPELGNCKALIDLQMYGNKLEGEIPSELGMLSDLETLMLFSNRLSGEIPIGIWEIQSLQNIIVYDNNLAGEIPKEIIRLKHLKNVSLFDNKFSGVIPQDLGMNSSLTQIDFTRNNFSGPIPPNLCYGKQLRKLILGQNHFQGNIPSDVGSCFTLTRLILKQNNLTGSLPEFVRNSDLLFVDLSNNTISGPIPSSLGKLSDITFIDLSINKLTGRIPRQLEDLVHLESLNMSHNVLEGLLPSQLSNCHKLSKLDLSRNRLNGTIPSSLRSLKELSILDLSENHFTGGVPVFLFQLEKLSSLQLGGNRLGGTISPSIGFEIGAQSLRSLNLSSNWLMGHVPLELGMLKMLEQLDICCNSLSGNLEAVSELRSLTLVNLSYNAFSGPIPYELMKLVSSSPFSLIGNRQLCINCRPQGRTSCQLYRTFKSCNISTKRGLKHVNIAMIVLASTLSSIVLVLGISYLFWRREGHRHNFFVPYEEEGASSLLDRIMEATENLNERYVIGRGGHGTVYKVTLGPTKVYALKKLVLGGSEGGNAGMAREIETAGKVRHRNLVKLEGFWLRKDYGLILYGYMTNGSLHDVLHGTCPLSPLEWNLRCRIALGTAHGLAYLHSDCDPAIVHRDINPTNILLDSEFEPHISDFGIAKLLDKSVGSNTCSRVQGTVGYMAPENAFSIRSNKESDVYAYGVVLLELVTGKKVLDPSFGGEMDIVGWVRSVLNEPEDIEAIVDSDLADEFISDPSIRKEVKNTVLIALRCSEKEPSKRPSMRDVVKQLIVANSRSKRT